ncbi:galactan 5-O-arabinofuranosyltransferase [Corynebacterium mendelii]|uniref:galactan 5-O-arabinofuranosyltransferase n=1 Tax=Corynebacterium mendelii TaxID=2765362 RepID=UPI0036272608
MTYPQQAAPRPDWLTADPAGEDYTTDATTLKHTVTGIIGAGCGGGAATLVVWLILKQTSLPAYGASQVTQALSAAGSVAVIAVVAVLCYLWVRDEHLTDADRAARATRRSRRTARAARRRNRRQAVSPGGRPGVTAAGGGDGGRKPPHHDTGTHPTRDIADDVRARPVRPAWRRIATVMACYLSPAGLVVTTTGLPLAATALYLDGITVDQGFRTQFLTRMTDSWRLSDMNYLGMPSFYPAGWFFAGGRLAGLLGIPGWQVFQPWALVSMAAAGCMLVPVWRRLCGCLPVATAIALTSTCVVLVCAATEPYAAIIALGVPAATILVRRAIDGHRAAMVGLIIYLGVSASMYTLYTAALALSVICVAVIFALVTDRSWWPIVRLIVIGLSSMAIASVVWGPYLWARYITHRPSSGATANHYLPLQGATVPLPMLSWSAIGVLCFLGLVYLVVRAVDRDVRAMGIALVVFYLWVLASMISTLAGRTLLGFRMDVVIIMQLATAGVLAIAELRLTGVSYLYPAQITRSAGRSITQVMMVVLAAAGIGYAQSIPLKNATAIDLAYTDTDGNGVRADRYPPDSGQWYRLIDDEIRAHGYIPRDTVVLTDELNFLSYHPYRGFQAFTSHYANPLGQFDRRNQQIETWAKTSWTSLSEPAAFARALDTAPWTAPQVFLLRGAADDTATGWKYDIAEDIYPNDPNVRFRGVYFNPAVFADNPARWDIHQMGPFVVVIEKTDTAIH